MSDVLPYGRQSIDEDDVNAVIKQLRDPWLTCGPRIPEFEQALADRSGAKYAVAVSSGTAALHLAALAAGVGPGKHGLTAAVTFVASANCIAYAGGTPAFADVDPATGLIDLDDLEARAAALAEAGTPPRVIIPVHLTGQAPDPVRIRAIADRYDAVVIDDAAHSLGGTYTAGNETVRCASCTHSEMAILSFHPVKHITTGEGGAILTNDEGLYKTLSELRTHGITRDPAKLTVDEGPWYYEQQTLGYNYRVTDVQCALGISQLRRLDGFIARRREIASRYDGAFASDQFVGRLAPLTEVAGNRNAYHLYVVRVLPRDGQDITDVARARRTLFESLVEKGIRPQVHYIPVPRQPWYREQYGVNPSDFPGAEEYYSGCITLPCFPDMRDEDVDRVVDAVATCLEKL